ncbi:hypothetical protein ACROYT_G011267 [Oculina patagonica]
MVTKKSSSVQLRNQWTPQPKDPQGNEKIVNIFQLDPLRDEQEYQAVQERFQRTCDNQIVKIERIHNPVLFNRYAIRKQQMDKANGSIERVLFHATKASAVKQINEMGFNRSYCGVQDMHGLRYGRGVYFVSDALNSASCTEVHSTQDANGFRYMYQVRVLVGEYTVGKSNLLVPPPKNPNNPEKLYDSVVDHILYPTIFVVFYDNQCYPEYLITFL